MEQLLLVVQLLLAVALIAAVLFQRSDADGFGLGSGSGANFLSGRASANLMTRTTAVLAGLFMINSLGLSIVASNQGHESIVDAVTKQEQSAAPASSAAKPAVPTVPVAGAPATKTDATAAEKLAPATEKPVDPKPPVVPIAESKPVVKPVEPAAQAGSKH